MDKLITVKEPWKSLSIKPTLKSVIEKKFHERVYQYKNQTYSVIPEDPIVLVANIIFSYPETIMIKKSIETIMKINLYQVDWNNVTDSMVNLTLGRVFRPCSSLGLIIADTVKGLGLKIKQKLKEQAQVLEALQLTGCALIQRTELYMSIDHQTELQTDIQKSGQITVQTHETYTLSGQSLSQQVRSRSILVEQSLNKLQYQDQTWQLTSKIVKVVEILLPIEKQVDGLFKQTLMLLRSKVKPLKPIGGLIITVNLQLIVSNLQFTMNYKSYHPLLANPFNTQKKKLNCQNPSDEEIRIKEQESSSQFSWNSCSQYELVKVEKIEFESGFKTEPPYPSHKKEYGKM